MAAGAVSAPLIIPMIQPQTNRVKNHIDTSTPVCLQSDTPGVQIFYTLDGSRPAASSRSYREPVLLPAGRVSVRALAETSDGRQSSVVTKVFSVDQAGTGTDPEVLMWTADSCLSLGFKEERTASVRILLTSWCNSESTQTFKVCLSRCLQCLVLRPLDPLARFCPRCGAVVPPVPVQRLPPAEGGQVLHTNESHSPGQVEKLSANSSFLLISQLKVASSSMCVRHYGICSDVMCYQCGHAVSCVVCWCCGANGDPNASYCGSCGVFLESPAPPTTYSDATPSSDPAPSVKLALPTVDRSTQTVGLYYPSATELHRKQQQRAEPLSQDPRPPLTAVSPGRGVCILVCVCYAELLSFSTEGKCSTFFLFKCTEKRLILALNAFKALIISATVLPLPCSSQFKLFSFPVMSVKNARSTVQSVSSSSEASSPLDCMNSLISPKSDKNEAEFVPC
uniref:Double zinc ribbon and ankyrin repeat domains 1 n=1 Tax=Acanthochromis polyacanthus TaxID=80966 RepID=A0A3Q1ER53_9TELE